MNDSVKKDVMEYGSWISELRRRYRSQQIKAAINVNTALLSFYWNLGKDIAEQQFANTYGSGFFKKLSADLLREIPDAKGFSPQNLWYVKRFYELYSPVFSKYSLPTEELQNLPQLGGKLQTALTEQDWQSLFHTPWGHHKLIKSKDNVLAKYSLEASNVHLGISKYELAKLYPVDLKSTLPSIEEIEREIDNKEMLG